MRTEFCWIVRLTGRVTLTAALLMLVCAFALCEETGGRWDYSDDFEKYAATVAEINAGQINPYSAGERNSRRGEAPSLCCVLVKTEGCQLPETEGLVYSLSGPRDRYTLFYSSQAAAERAIEVFQASKGVCYAEPDTELFAASLSGESFLSWGAEAMGFGAYLGHCRACGSGSAVIAIVDSGISPHPFLADRLIGSGYDYIDADDEADDQYGHGTQVAGIAADCTRGMPVCLYPIRVLNAAGNGKTSNVINAIEEAVLKGVDVINLSMESFAISEALDEAIRNAIDHNVVVVAAAGNSACDTVYVSPAHMTDRGIVVVGSAEHGDDSPTRAAYSNYGDSVDLYAYGSDILCCDMNGDYSTQSGTSMAAPHVSGLCAMLRLIHPGLSPSLTAERLTAACATGEVNVPAATRMIPAEPGFQLDRVKLTAGRQLRLPVAPLPASACEALTYESDDPTVAAVIDGELCAMAEGNARVTASCPGLLAAFEVEVVPDDGSPDAQLPASLKELAAGAFEGDASLKRIVLPEGLAVIGDGAFDHCTALETVSIPSSVTYIGENTFSNAVIVCGPEGSALEYAREKGLQYIIMS